MANINIRIDKAVKEKAEKVFSKLGITPTAAITIFYHQVIRTNGIPFELKANEPNENTLQALAELEEMEKHPEDYKTYDNVDELMEDLLE